MRKARLTLAAAIVGLSAIVSGAFITSTKIALQPGRPEPGADAHRAVALFAIGCVCAAIIARRPAGIERTATFLALASLIASAASGWKPPLSPSAAVCHAVFAHLFTASITIALVMTTSSWNRTPVRVATGSWSVLRPAAIAAPAVVFGQIVLGALYRQELTGVMPHMLGAMIVALLTMTVSAIVLQHFSKSPDLKRAATLLISAVLLQVCLGIAVFTMLLLNVRDTQAFLWLATAHVTTGTLVLAASVVMAMQWVRGLSPAEVSAVR
jgi:heme A synthase